MSDPTTRAAEIAHWKGELLQIRAREDAVHVLLTALNAEKQHLSGTAAQIEHHIRHLQTISGPFSRFSNDLLAVLFESAATTVDPPPGLDAVSQTKWLPDIWRARALFVFSCVCRQWRSAAISTPALWRFIHVPDRVTSRVPSAKWRDRIQVALERSLPSPIEVSIRMLGGPGMTKTRKTLDCIANERHRWTSFKANIRVDDAVMEIRTWLSGPLPCLQRVELTETPAGIKTPFIILGDSPVLHSVNLKFATCVALPVDACCSSSLRTLTISFEQCPAWFLTLLPRLERLEYLALTLKFPVVAASPTSIVLPVLSCLTLNGGALEALSLIANSIEAPRLRQLIIEGWVDTPGNTPVPVELFDRFASQIEEVTVSTTPTLLLQLESLLVLRFLRKVSFLGGPSPPPRLFDVLAGAERGIWPNLLHMFMRVESMLTVDQRALGRLVQARCMPNAPGTTATWSPLRIEVHADLSVVEHLGIDFGDGFRCLGWKGTSTNGVRLQVWLVGGDITHVTGRWDNDFTPILINITGTSRT